jgi:hypothetical protein
MTGRTLQGMARVRSGQALAWPLSAARSVRRGSRIKRDFACTFTRHFPPVLVVLRAQSRLRLEGRARTLSGPSPDLSPARTLAPSPVASSWPRWSRQAGGQAVPARRFHRATPAVRAARRLKIRTLRTFPDGKLSTSM